jgi:hypothetical protein
MRSFFDKLVQSNFSISSFNQRLKSRQDLLFIPNIPMFHHSIIPLINYTPVGEIKAGSSGPGVFAIKAD